LDESRTSDLGVLPDQAPGVVTGHRGPIGPARGRHIILVVFTVAPEDVLAANGWINDRGGDVVWVRCRLGGPVVHFDDPLPRRASAGDQFDLARVDVERIGLRFAAVAGERHGDVRALT